MVDVSLPSLVPRVIADLRPCADASASAWIDRPPLAVPAAPLAGKSLSQEALVARSVLDPAAASKVGGPANAPERVLKPWGVPMLPWEPPSDTRPEDAGTGSADDPLATASPGERRPDEG